MFLYVFFKLLTRRDRLIETERKQSIIRSYSVIVAPTALFVNFFQRY